MTSIREFCAQPNGADFGPEESLTPLWQGDVSLVEWEEVLRPALRDRWFSLLGRPSGEPAAWSGPARKVGEVDGPDFRVCTYLQPSGPEGQEQKVAILFPHRPAANPTPCAVVPFYDLERVIGLLPCAVEETPIFAPAGQDNDLRFGEHLARMGMVVACVEAFPFNTVPDPGGTPFDWWRSAAAKLLSDHPHWTGIGKLAADTSRALDLLLEQPDVDTGRVLAYGHSLGGKMAFYTAALDPRVTCLIGSDYGLPWRSTNWDAPWYHGPERVAQAERTGMAHHQLLALLAPRPFLLIAGEADDVRTWQYLEAARPAYELYQASNNLGCLHHAAGHRPPLHVLDVVYGWLGDTFTLPHRCWR